MSQLPPRTSVARPPVSPPRRGRAYRHGPDGPLAGPAIYTMTLSQRLLFSQGLQSKGPNVLGGVSNRVPLYFTRVPDGRVFMSNGLQPVYSWDGLRFDARTVGLVPPETAVTVAGSGSGSLSGTYTAYVRFVDEFGRVSNLSPVSASVTVASVASIDYTAVTVPTDVKAARKQILRNTSGQALTYYVDIDTDDLAGTSFSSTLADTALSARTAVALFDGDGNSLANRHRVPPSDKPFLCAYLDRVFACGDVAYDEGHTEVANNSATVQGVATHWTESFVGREIYITGVGKSYEVTAIDETAQTLTLGEVYKGSTDKFAVYAIRPLPVQRRTLQFSEAGLYDSWPATNGVTIEDTGDEITGLLSADSFLFVVLRRHIYRLTYNTSPLKDGGLFLAARRGCVNSRSWVQLDDRAYFLDENGIWSWQFGEKADPVSAPVQDVFFLDHPDPDDEPLALRVNWNASRWFHAVHSRDETTIRWFVALSGARLPRHALCYNYLLEAWWVEEYAWPVGASCLSEGVVQRPIVCGPARKAFGLGVGTLDGPDPKTGDTRLACTSTGAEEVASADAVFPAANLADMPVSISVGRGKFQTRVISAAEDGVANVVVPWLIRPDTTSVFQLGGFRWRWVTGLARWTDREGDQRRRVEVEFRPTRHDNSLDARVYHDSPEADTYASDWPPSSAEADGVEVKKDEADAVVDLTTRRGRVLLPRPGRRDHDLPQTDDVRVELRGVSGPDPVVIHAAGLEATERGE